MTVPAGGPGRNIPRKVLWPALVLALAVCAQAAGAETGAGDYDALVKALRAARAPDRVIEGLSPRQVQVRAAWESGKLIDGYLLAGSRRASEVVDRLAADLGDDPSRLYYALQFYRAYEDAPPSRDLHWGFYQYLLAVNDPREREELAQRALDEKWNWDKLRAEVKLAGRDNKEYVFTDTPGRPWVYRVMTAKRGPYRGQKVLDLGLGNDYKPRFEIKAGDYETVRAECRDASSCVLEAAPGGEKDLFTYPADVVKVFDGDTFEAVADLGFGVTARRHFRLWGLDAPEINTPEGRRAQKFLEGLLSSGPVTVRAMRPDKYGRYLADVWTAPAGKLPVYANRALIDAGLASAEERK